MSKFVDLQIQGNRCYYKLTGCSDDEFQKIIEYKSWLFKSWKFGTERKYFTFPYINRNNNKILYSSIGFAPILIRFLQGLGYLINGKEMFRSKEIHLGNMLYKLYDFQEDAMNSWIDSGCLGVIKMPTGSGKTINSCAIIKKMGVKTIICMHTSDLLVNAWVNTLVEQFGESIKSKIGIVGGGLDEKDRKNMRLLADTSYQSNMNQDIVLATAQTLLNHLNELCNERIGLLVWDEVQHVSAEQFNKVAGSIRAPYRLGASATIQRQDGKTPLIHGLMGDTVYQIKIKELVKKGILVEPIFNCIIINDNKIQNNIATCGKIKLELSRHVKKMSSSSVLKVKYILKLAGSLCVNKKRFILYTDFVADKNNGVFVRDFFVKELNVLGIRVIGVSSEMSSVEREKIFNMLKNGKLDGIVAGKTCSEGVNIPAINSIIMANATKSTILYTQRCGRCLRTMKDDINKKNGFIYELIIDTPMERKWSVECFHEYTQEGYTKEFINVDNIK